MQSFPSPRLNAYLALLRDFQRALLPKPSSLVRSINQAPSSNPHCFEFALGTSSHGTLSRAVVECVQQIKQKLGPHRSPDLCQLFVTADTYGSDNIRFASAVSLILPLQEGSTSAVTLSAACLINIAPGYSHIAHLNHPPVVCQYVQECLSGSNHAPPVVLGGVVQVIYVELGTRWQALS